MMKHLTIKIENCYGIRSLDTKLDFSKYSSIAIYAQNGSMKTSLAKVFLDVANGVPSKDSIFTSRVSTRVIQDETGSEIPKENVLVFRSFNDSWNLSSNASTLLVNEKLRNEYDKLNIGLENAKNIFLKTMKELSKTSCNIPSEISRAFTGHEDQFYTALEIINNDLDHSEIALLGSTPYDTIFNDKVVEFTCNEKVSKVISDYITKYNELLNKSVVFKKGIFTPYNASQIAKQLSDNGFFQAQHKVLLNSEGFKPITSQSELEDLIKIEKDSITQDKELRKKFTDIEKLLHKNASMREFEYFLQNNHDLLPRLSDMVKFKQDVWKSYIAAHIHLFTNLYTSWQNANISRSKIQSQAKKERTQWEAVIDIFNQRFSVPFKIRITNREDVILGSQTIPTAEFLFNDGTEEARIDKTNLEKALSAGELRALYILNVIFEVEARKKSNQSTLMLVDDIADSFDYKNKYAIIQYLADISEYSNFQLLILTHNFDFFRSTENRIVHYNNCLMAVKNNSHIKLEKATGIRNIFVKEWKGKFHTNPKAKIACITFMRNLIEYTRGTNHNDYKKLTAMLHWKEDTDKIKVHQLNTIYTRVFPSKVKSKSSKDNTLIIDLITNEAMSCLKDTDSLNLANKIVLSIAIRLAAERYIISQLPSWTQSDQISNQTQQLLREYKKLQNTHIDVLNILERVELMTPENIHLNSFMYEPILDMSDIHLKQLYCDVASLNKQPQQASMFESDAL